ncbi:E3 ubiquitin protein ligase DRIP1-like [Arachis ipaensis]|uniref:E3 ubiquitin protein ligase DRIP1-like n=1 Tax=Arachis ipaensis TaxID=130454 RepID=UPI000A2B69C2|nr:E3 ubiquitin protein ligase DRIP1-like [Arachis ipaensis]
MTLLVIDLSGTLPRSGTGAIAQEGPVPAQRDGQAVPEPGSIIDDYIPESPSVDLDMSIESLSTHSSDLFTIEHIKTSFAICKKCIHHKIIEEELEHCPVCDLDLGPKPLEKLRHDESMQSIRNTIFPPRKENVVNKADDDVANAEKNELLGDLGIILFEDPENEKDVALKDLLDTSKEHVENIKESLLPSEKSHCMENKNVKGKSICLDNVEEYNTDEILQIEDNNNGSQVEKSRQKKKKHKKKTKNIAEIYQKHETIIISGESTEYLPLALEDFDQVNILRDNSSFWICLEASEKQ